MTVLNRAEQFLRRDLWAREADAVPRVRRFGLRALRLTIAVAMEFRQRLVDARAAGLVYTTLLSRIGNREARAGAPAEADRDPGDRLLQRRDRAVESALQGMTLRSFAESE